MLVTRPVRRAATGNFASMPCHGSPGVAHAERNAVGFMVDLDDLDLHLLSDVEHLGRMIDPSPRNVSDMQQTVDPAEVHEGAVVGDVLDYPVDHLPLFEVLHEFLTLLARVSSSTVRRETTILPRRRSIFRIWNGCVTFIRE